MTARYTDLAGRVVVVTGGSRALGASTALAFAENGAKVVVSGRDQAAIDDVVAAIRWEGNTAIGVAADATDAAQLVALRETTERDVGPADILVAFAGGSGEPTPSLDLTLEKWEGAVATNLTATFLTLQAFLGGMIERGGGAVVTMASAAARQPAKSNVGYAAAKAGVIAMTRHLATELAPMGVRINCIAPSAIENERMRSAMTDEARAGLAATFPLRRIGQPSDVAEAALYLSSASAGWITGVVLDVAGGKIMV
ncbi:MAG TPA: SDR family NAD(P)-dependent oxidoreductase [Gemmatimonadaceae bacterium]|nr:SDR family NAD(P)-dependent oxidoreductase [Gemmatimonadaceae bacterium]